MLVLDRVGPGVHFSKAVQRAGYNGVVVEVWPDSPGAADLVVKDSDDVVTGFNPTVDSRGIVAGLAAYKKLLVTSVEDFIQLQLTVAAGLWSAKITPVPATAIDAITIAGAIDLTQYGGNPVGAANPLDVSGPVTISDGQVVPCWAISQESAAAAAQSLTRAAVAAQRHHITAFEVAIRGAAAGNDINVQLQDGAGVVYWRAVIGSGALQGSRVPMPFPQPIQLPVNSNAVLQVDAGGAAVVTMASMSGYTK